MLKVKNCVRRLVLLIMCIGYTIGCNSADNELKVSGISSLTVQRGRAVVIAADAYRIIYNETKYADCLVYVTSTPTFSCGVISPDVFNYSSKPDLSYTHYGCDKGTETIDLALSLTSSNHNVFTTEHFTIKVTVMSIAEPILTPSDKIIVPPDNQKALVSLKLSDNLDCEYAIVSPIELPYYGVVSGPIKQWLACNSSQSVEYTLTQQHQWQHQPEDRIIIAIRSNGSISYEQMPVIINSLNDKSTTCVLEEGVVNVTFNCYTPVNTKNLNAQNCPFPRDWKIQVTKGSYSAISLLTSYSRHLTTYTFTFGQLADGMVAYQRKAFSSTPQTYNYQYSVHDVHGRVIFNNSIVSRNTALAGQHVEVITNAGIDVVEGQSAVITRDVLEFLDHDCTTFTLGLVENPIHGYFRLARTNTVATRVTLQDLEETNVVFEHSGADSFGDRAVWEVQCSNTSIGTFVQPIRVMLIDDTPPHLKENAILTVYTNSVVHLSSFHLQAVDVDSCDATIKYTILSMGGQFYSSKEDALNNNGNRIAEFRQQDIDDGKVWYRPPEEISIPENDSVLFNVSDESSPPNVLANQKLIINILISYECAFCEAVLDPQRLSDIPVVEIAGETNLLPAHFRPFAASHDWLDIYIIDPPQFGVIIPNNFTLESLRDDAVVYRHNGVNHDCNDSFVFQMRNATGGEVFGKMVVSVVKQNTTHSVTLAVDPLEFSIIRPTFAADSIVITDSPVCTEHILFIIESLPQSGKMYCNITDSFLAIGSWFSLKHLRDGLLTYHSTVSSTHQSQHTYNDSFSFSLQSSIGNLTANGEHLHIYPITYNLSDPMVTLNNPKSLDHCSENEYLCYHNLSVSNINVVSNIANDSELRIVVKDEPSCGRLILNGTKVSEFTVSQLKKNQIAYEFNATFCSNANYTDKFGFIIKIAGQATRAVKNYLHLYWSYVMVDRSKIYLNETDGAFNVTIRRTGYLNETSKVFCTKGSISASLCTTCNRLKVATFSPGQSIAHCTFQIEDNHIAEGYSVKKYYVSLKNLEGAVITSGNVTDVYISDLEDYPVIQFKESNGVSPSHGRGSCTHQLTVKEGENSVASAVIERIGDSSKQVTVMCTANAESARRSQDYQERDKKRVTFEPGQTTAFCNVTIVNDDEFEPRERFQLKLAKPRMLAVTNSSADTLCVYIEEDEEDRPSVYFNKTRMFVREGQTNYTIHIPIIREGKTNLAEMHVAYHTKLFANDTANSTDFEEININPGSSVEFKSVQTVAHGELVILADNIPESNETLHVELLPRPNYRLKEPSIITIIILDDSYRVISFSVDSVTMNEPQLFFQFHLNRTGSLDYNFNISGEIVATTFNDNGLFTPVKFNFPKHINQISEISYVPNDDVYSGKRTARYCLVSSQQESQEQETRFIHQCISITVYDEEDYPTVEFESAGYTVQAPDYQEECSDLFVAVVRNNDINYSSSTICYSTIDDTAVAGEDYYESRGTLHFAVGEQRKVIPIQLCSHHLPTNKTKRFHVHIAEGNNSTRVVGPSDIAVLIVGREPIVPFFHEETLIMSSNHELVQPGVHYNITGENFLLCVTACDPLSMHFNASFCSIHGIDNSLTVYQWEIVYNASSFVPMVYSTFFASPNTQILDEFYLSLGSRVRCKATAVDVTGVAGYKRPSQTVEILEENTTNTTQCSNSIGGFTAEFHPASPFTGQPQDSIKLTGSLSAAGNAIPLVYSRQLHSVLNVMTYYSTRRNSCVLLAGQAPHVAHPGVSSVVPTNCGWTFEVWMSLQELEENCHGTVSHAGKQTSIHLELELAYFQGNISTGVELKEYRQQLNVSKNFTHESLPDIANVNYSKYDVGFIKLLDVIIKDILIVKFQSFANFSGQFLVKTNSSSDSIHLSNQNISLFLEETEHTLHNCTQTWRFHSTDILLSGPHNVTLVPCVLPDGLTWSPSVMLYCIPMPPITFQLHAPTGVHVSPHFDTIQTELLLLKKADNGSHYTGWRFGLDDVVYGGVMADTQHQQQCVKVAVQKIVACSTTGGYVPQYNDKASLTGCLTKTHFITQLHTILDVKYGRSDDKFDAKVIDDIENSYTGWSFRVEPLFDTQMAIRQWFIHVVYSESQNNGVIIKHEIRLIQLETPCSSMDNVADPLAWCQIVVTVITVLSVIVVVLLVFSLICWKWNKMKDKCDAVFGDCYRNKSETSLSKIRRSHRYRAEIQELPHAFLPPNGIHVNREQCTKADTPPLAQLAGGSSNKRLTGSKKYIVETTM